MLGVSECALGNRTELSNQRTMRERTRPKGKTEKELQFQFIWPVCLDLLPVRYKKRDGAKVETHRGQSKFRHLIDFK